jgi:ribosomal subunit interface protein
MNIRFYFQKISETDKEKLKKYFNDKKLGRLVKLLQRGNLELAKFVLNAKYHSRHNIFLVRLGLKIINKDLRAEEKGRNLIEAFDLAFDSLIRQLRKLEG